MMQVLRGKRALVTGAASGIGRAIALALGREGADLYLLDIDEENLALTARAADRLGVSVATVVCDLAQPARIRAAVGALIAGWGRLNILVNSAGIAYYGPTHQMTTQQWNRLLSVNLLAPIQLVHELLPLLAAEEEAHILNVSSIFGLVPMRKGAAYQTSKFGLVGFSAALRAEYSRRNFGVTALCPGFVRTPMLETYAMGRGEDKRHAIPRWASLDADMVAARAIVAIRRNQGLVVMHPLARGLWRLARLSPSLVDWVTREGWRRRKPLQIPPR